MVNSILTPDIIAKEGLMQLENALVLGAKVRTDFSSEFAMVGDTIRIDRPVRFKGQKNNLDVSSYNEDIVEGSETIKMDKTFTVKFKVTSKEKTLSLDQISERIVQPAVLQMKDQIEADLAELYPYFYHFDGTPGTVPATFLSLANVGAIMTDGAVPTDRRFAAHSTQAAATLADKVTTLSPEGKALTALERASIGRIANFDNFEFVHAPTHTVGAHGGTPLVNGGSQGVTYLSVKDQKWSSLITDGWPNSVTGVLKKGDVITIAGVFAVNPVSKQSTGRLQTFTVIEDANSGASTGPATIKVSPPIIPANATIADGAAYATVTAAPADNAPITVKTGTAGASYKQSLLMHPDALVLVSRALDVPSGAGVKTSTQTGNRTTIRVTEWIDGNTLDHNFRFDMLYGVKVLDERLGARLTN